jgi:hypothetical protein
MHRHRNRLYFFRRENLLKGNPISLGCFCSPVRHGVACDACPRQDAGVKRIRRGRSTPPAVVYFR